MKLRSPAPATRAGQRIRKGSALLFVAAAFLLMGAERPVGPRGSDPVTEISRLLDRAWDENDPYVADRRKQLENLSRQLDNLGDLSRAVFLPWFNANDPVATEIHDRVVSRFKTQMEKMLRQGTVDQRIAAANLLAAAAQGARTRETVPELHQGAPGTDSMPRPEGRGQGLPRQDPVSRPSGAPTSRDRDRAASPSLPPAVMRSLRDRLRDLGEDLIKLTRETGLGPRSSEVQAAAARALGQIEADPRYVVPALDEVLQRGSPNARRAAATAMETMVRIMIPQEMALTGGSEMISPPVAGTSLNQDDAQQRLKTMTRILRILPRSMQDSDREVRFRMARAYHRLANAYAKSIPVPPRIPPANLDDPRLVDDFIFGQSQTETLLAEIEPLARVFKEQSRRMAAAVRDPAVEVRVELCLALEKLAEAQSQMQRTEDSLDELRSRLRRLRGSGKSKQPSGDEERLGPPRKEDDQPPSRSDRDRVPRIKRKDSEPIPDSSRPRKQDRKSAPQTPDDQGPGLGQAIPMGRPRVAQEWAGADFRRDRPLPSRPNMDGLLAPTVVEANTVNRCAATLEAPVPRPVVQPVRGVVVGQLAAQKDDQDQPEVLPRPRPAVEAPSAEQRDYMQAAVNRLRDPSIRVRLSALNVIEGMGRYASDSVPALSQTITTDCNRFVRWQSARILGRMAPANASRAVPALMSMLNEYEDSQARLAACSALELYAREAPEATAQAVPLLSQVVHHGELEMRLEVLAVLRALGRPYARKALPSVAWVLKLDKEASVRAAAARLLGHFGEDSQRALPTLRRALADEDADVRRAASEAILAIPAPERSR